jgi:hypothetical protein
MIITRDRHVRVFPCRVDFDRVWTVGAACRIRRRGMPMPHAQSSVARCPRLCLILVGVLGVARLGWREDTCREGVPLKTAPGTAPEGRCSKIHNGRSWRCCGCGDRKMDNDLRKKATGQPRAWGDVVLTWSCWSTWTGHDRWWRTWLMGRRHGPVGGTTNETLCQRSPQSTYIQYTLVN